MVAIIKIPRILKFVLQVTLLIICGKNSVYCQKQKKVLEGINIAICNTEDTIIKVPNLFLRHKIYDYTVYIEKSSYKIVNNAVIIEYAEASPIIVRDGQPTIDGMYNDYKIQPKECIEFNVIFEGLTREYIQSDYDIFIYYNSKKLSVFKIRS